MGGCTRYAGKKFKTVKADKEKSENVGNFYTGKAKCGRSDDEMWRSRGNDYGKRPHGPVGQLPLPLTGMIRF